MKILRPILTNRISQLFGEDKACIMPGTNKYKAVDKMGICPVGYTSLYGYYNMKGHNGMDMNSYVGEKIHFPVQAPTMWYIKDASDSSGGLGVDVFSRDAIAIESLDDTVSSYTRKLWESQGKKLHVKFRFWHISKSMMPMGNPVSFGDVIALAGNTGASTGPHLHWGFKFTDGNGKSLDKDNGYYGGHDFYRWYDPEFVLSYIANQNSETVDDVLQKVSLINLVLSFLINTKVDINKVRQDLYDGFFS